jgi:hypothetical protein
LGRSSLKSTEEEENGINKQKKDPAKFSLRKKVNVQDESIDFWLSHSGIVGSSASHLHPHSFQHPKSIVHHIDKRVIDL